jgi:adenine-specific DNA methylase
MCMQQKKVKCELCGNEMSEVSLYSHMRAKHSTPAAAAAAKPEVDGAAAAGAGDVANVVNAEDGADESRRPKRQTAQKSVRW